MWCGAYVVHRQTVLLVNVTELPSCLLHTILLVNATTILIHIISLANPLTCPVASEGQLSVDDDVYLRSPGLHSLADLCQSGSQWCLPSRESSGNCQ